MSFPMKKGAGLAGLIIFSLLLLLSTGGFAQKRLRYEAERQRGSRVDGERVDYLIDKVVIRQGETTIYADSAVVKRKNNTAEAFGRVRVIEGDSVNITSKRLIFEGGAGTAKMRDNVVYRDGETTLLTDNLDYNKGDGVASYFGGGRMVDGENTLVSRSGVFDKQNNMARFYGKVELQMPDRTIFSDTLFYNTETKLAQFKGPTTIVPKDGSQQESFGEDGLIYDAGSGGTTLVGAKIENPDYVITAKKTNYDKINDVFTATGNVVMTSKEQDVVITGGRSVYDKKTGYTYVYDNPVMRRPVQGDTLFLSADTLVAIEAELDADKRMLAFHDVRIYKNDLQGISDSLVYYFNDSTIYFYKDPVLWSNGSQMTGDTINVEIRNNQIDRLFLRSDAFVISEDSVQNFNQVKGRQITALFNDESQLDRINVDGNAESIYFVLEETDKSLVGMNRMTSGLIHMFFIENALDHIKVYQNPEGKMVPPHELQEPEKRLNGFAWRTEERPTRESVLYRGIENLNIPPLGELSNPTLKPVPSDAGRSPVERKAGGTNLQRRDRKP